MQIYSWAGAALILALSLTGGAHAAEQAEFPTAIEAYRQGLDAKRAGHADAAVRALEYAAEKGILGAQLKLAKMYATGDGVARSDAKAFRHYQQIADRYAEISPSHPVARYVAEAFVALAQYYRTGVPQIRLSPTPHRAFGLLLHAASYFGDADAQYYLAHMYLVGEGVFKNPNLAVNWLANASKKQHAPSQALLGDLLWRGSDEIVQQPLKGLALLTLAHQNAGRDDAALVEPLYARAMAEAKPDERDAAEKIAVHWRKRPQDGETAIAAEDTADAEAAIEQPAAAVPAASPAGPPAPATTVPSTPAAARPGAATRSAAAEVTPARPAAGLGFQSVGAEAPSTPR